VVDRSKPVEELKLMSWSRQIDRPGQAGKPEQGLVERPKATEQPKLMSWPKPSFCRSTHRESRPCRKFEGIVGVNPNPSHPLQFEAWTAIESIAASRKHDQAVCS